MPPSKKNLLKEKPQRKIPGWTQFPVNSLENSVEHSSAILMGHHLIIIAHDNSKGGLDSNSKSECESAVLFAVDLRDNSVQEAKLPESMFYYHHYYTFSKWGDNKIVKFGGVKLVEGIGNSYTIRTLVVITVSSFEPFSIECEEIQESDNQPLLNNHTAQVYNDCLYVYGGIIETFSGNPENKLWCFDLNKRVWSLCQTTGESPGGRAEASSFISQDNLYIYGGEVWGDPCSDDIFALDLHSMEWKKIQASDAFSKEDLVYSTFKLNGDLYQDNLLTLRNKEVTKKDQAESEVLCSWNITTNTLSTFHVQELSSRNSNLIVYKNLLLTCESWCNEVRLSILNLDEFDLETTKSSEETRTISLFMNEEGSDVTFKIQNKTIPAHKDILIQKSKHFASLFDSKSLEVDGAKQKSIQIKDCDFPLFQEFLRWIYCEEVKLNEDLAIELLAVADRYLQEDLREKCLDFLKFNLNSANVYKILDFAREQNLPELKNWCLKFFDYNIDETNVSELITYLGQRQHQPEFAEENNKLRDQALNLVTCNFVELSRKEKNNMRFYETFLIDNVSIDTILQLAEFINSDQYEKLPEEFRYKPRKIQADVVMQAKAAFDKNTSNLKDALLAFTQKNREEVKQKKIDKDFPKTFSADLLRYKPKKVVQGKEKISQEEQKIDEESEKDSAGKAKRGRKRKEPVKEKESPEEEATLKKTKKTSASAAKNKRK